VGFTVNLGLAILHIETALVLFFFCGEKIVTKT
jgi:hypothetical protein